MSYAPLLKQEASQGLLQIPKSTITCSSYKLKFTDGEQFRVLTLEVLKISLDTLHIRFHISRRHNHVLTLYQFALKVKTI